MSEQTCKTCAHAEWWRLSSGRISESAPGLCVAPTPLQDRRLWPKAQPIPIAALMGSRSSVFIYRNKPYKECPLWKRK
jgi:hypothetical protein